MPSRKAAIKLTANFLPNLNNIREFWNEAEASKAYDKLLEDLLETVIPNLEHHPRIGRSFLRRRQRSAESEGISRRLLARVGTGDVREYLTGEYIILYALARGAVYLLAIKHHRQLSFDVKV